MIVKLFRQFMLDNLFEDDNEGRSQILVLLRSLLHYTVVHVESSRHYTRLPIAQASLHLLRVVGNLSGSYPLNFIQHQQCLLPH